MAADSLARSRGLTGPRALLPRLLADASLLESVRELAPAALTKVIRHVGLEDASELLALASREQLEGVLDEDLWRSERPGEDETFDAGRFALWLEVMLELGADRAADRLADLDEELVALGVSELALVLDVDEMTLQHWGQDDDALSDEALLDKALESSLSFELDRYLLISKSHEGWDALLSLLTTLYARQPDFFTRLLERCCAVSNETIDDGGGLYRVLTEAEQLAEDVADAREERRAREGFVAPAAARSLLALALQEPIGDDVITRDYFRRLETRPRGPSSGGSDARLLALLREEEGFEEISPRARRLTSQAGEAVAGALVREALERLRDDDPARFERRSAELAFVANVLLAGSARDGRAYRPIEAAEDALASCEAGLRQLSRGPKSNDALQVLREHSLVTLFGLGWRARKAMQRE